MWPNPAFLPKVLSSIYTNTTYILPAFHSADMGIRQELCPVRSLRMYIDKTASWRTTDQLFVCLTGSSKDSPVKRQTHWITEFITKFYASACKVLSNPVKCHSTRSVATSEQPCGEFNWQISAQQQLGSHCLCFPSSIGLMLLTPQTTV